MDAAEDWNLVLWDLADLATRLGGALRYARVLLQSYS